MSNLEEQTEKPKRIWKSKDFWVSIVILFSVSLVWFGGGTLADLKSESAINSIAKQDSAQWNSQNKLVQQWQLGGVYGDKFGAINALFSALAFAGIIFTLILQRRDLNLQRRSIDSQNKNSTKQNFETSFFALLNTYSSIVDQLRTPKESKGRAVFSEFLLWMKTKSNELAVFDALRKLHPDEIFKLNTSGVIEDGMKSKLLNEDIANIEEAIEKKSGIIDKFIKADQKLHLQYINSSYNLAHSETGGALSHYFRNLYVILKFIDETAQVNSEEKKIYIRIIRAQLSENELLCLAYNCIAEPDGAHADHEFGNPKMGILCKKYKIFKHINKSVLFHESHAEILKFVGAM